MFDTLLIASHGAIVCRILRTLRAIQVKGIAVYAEADLSSLHVCETDEAPSLSEDPVAQIYLVVEKIIAATLQSDARVIHPGYGFLPGNATFAETYEVTGLASVGLTLQQLHTFDLKRTARVLAKTEGMPLLEGGELLADSEEACQAAEAVGCLVMLKSAADSRRIGMRACRDAHELSEVFAAVQRLGQNNFSDAGVFLERYTEYVRHLEVQIFGDGGGEVTALGVRSCLLQQRDQKVIGETPAPNLPDGMAQAPCSAAIVLGKTVNYRSVGTAEFVYDSAAQRFYSFEVSTRLQAKHGVTEQVWDVGLVCWMIVPAAGDLPPSSELAAGLQPRDHVIQAWIYAEDPGRQF